MKHLDNAIQWYKKLPEKKIYLEFLSALLTVPVLITVILLNIINLKKNTQPTVTSDTLSPTTIPTLPQTTSQSPNPEITVKVVYVTPAPESANTLAPSPTSTPLPTDTPLPTPTIVPTNTPTISPSSTPTITPTVTGTPSIDPTPTI